MSTWVTALVVGRGPVPAHQGRAVQVDPFKPTLKAPGTKRLKLKHDKLVSSFAFIFNLRRYIPGCKVGRCRLTVSNPMFKAPMVSAISA